MLAERPWWPCCIPLPVTCHWPLGGESTTLTNVLRSDRRWVTDACHRVWRFADGFHVPSAFGVSLGIPQWNLKLADVLRRGGNGNSAGGQLRNSELAFRFGTDFSPGKSGGRIAGWLA